MASPEIKSPPKEDIDHPNHRKEDSPERLLVPPALEVEEIECDIDENFDNEKFKGKMINNSFINKLKDFSSFNPSGNKGREKISNS